MICGVPPGVPETCVDTEFRPMPRTHAASRKRPLDGADLPSFSVGVVDPTQSSQDVPVNLTLQLTRRESSLVIKGGTCRCCQTVPNVRLQTKLVLHYLGHLEQQLVCLRIWISRYLLTYLWIEIPRALISWIWYHVESVIIHTIVIALWNLNLLGPLMACCLKFLIIDIRIYISTDPLN